MASTEPITSALITSGSSWSWPSRILANRSSSRGARLVAIAAWRWRASLVCAIERATRSSATALTSSPALGGADRPMTWTGCAGTAVVTSLPFSSNIARTRPWAVPATSASPTCREPRRTSTVATGPRPLSRCASMIEPWARRLGLALRFSSTSATSRIVSISVSRFCWVLAETSTNWVLPPYSSATRSWVVSCWRTRAGLASGLSILLTATTIGTPAALAWLIASTVCGMTPSSAATTSTATSVTAAPRARMAVNASWPGVSMNVTRRPSWPARTW